MQLVILCLLKARLASLASKKGAQSVLLRTIKNFSNALQSTKGQKGRSRGTAIDLQALPRVKTKECKTCLPENVSSAIKPASLIGMFDLVNISAIPAVFFIRAQVTFRYQILLKYPQIWISNCSYYCSYFLCNFPPNSILIVGHSYMI